MQMWIDERDEHLHFYIENVENNTHFYHSKGHISLLWIMANMSNMTINVHLAADNQY